MYVLTTKVSDNVKDINSVAVYVCVRVRVCVIQPIFLRSER